MPFCSRRTWKTPSGFTTWPTPGCYDDGVVLPRFQSHTHTGKTTGVYHDNHPDTAPDAGLRVPLLTRHHPGCCPTFIPAFTGVNTVLGPNNAVRLHEPDPSVELLGFALWGLTAATLPVGMGVAILKYRSYDIDRLISRTVANAVLWLA